MITAYRRRSVFAAMLLCLTAPGATLRGPNALAHTASEAPPAAMADIAGHFALTTADGRSVTNESYRGKWLVIYFGYTSCPDACPLTLNNIGVALDKLGPLADKVQPLFITVDPEHDTRAAMTQYLKSFDPRIVGLSGTPKEIAAAANQYHVYFRTRQLGNGEYTVDHNSLIYVIAPDGQFAKLLTPDLPGHELADQLHALIQ
jgi:protein SCO1/2